MIKEIIITFSGLFAGSGSLHEVEFVNLNDILRKDTKEVISPFDRVKTSGPYHILPSKWKKVINKSN